MTGLRGTVLGHLPNLFEQGDQKIRDAKSVLCVEWRTIVKFHCLVRSCPSLVLCGLGAKPEV